LTHDDPKIEGKQNEEFYRKESFEQVEKLNFLQLNIILLEVRLKILFINKSTKILKNNIQFKKLKQ
jgi:hypothetical protein